MVLTKQNLEHLEGKEILILRGSKDRVIPAESTDLLIDTLKGAGAEVTVFEIDAGHELTETDVERASHWLGDTSRSPMAHASDIHNHATSQH